MSLAFLAFFEKLIQSSAALSRSLVHDQALEANATGQAEQMRTVDAERSALERDNAHAAADIEAAELVLQRVEAETTLLQGSTATLQDKQAELQARTLQSLCNNPPVARRLPLCLALSWTPNMQS